MDPNATLPLNRALLAADPIARREVVSALALKGLAETRRLLVRIGGAADFAGRAPHYVNATTPRQKVEAHGRCLDSLAAHAGDLAGRAGALRHVAETLDLAVSEVEELYRLTGAVVCLIETLRTTWATERERLLRAEELANVKMGSALNRLFGEMFGHEEAAVAA